MAETIGIGIIGAGSIASQAHIPGYAALPKKCRVVALADIDMDRAEKLAKDKGIPKAFEDYRQLLDLDEIDAVSVCTPPAVHAQATIDALEAGKHVMCEKPMAMNGEEASKMVKAATDHELTIQNVLRETYDFKEGIAASAERRVPNFQGR